MANNKMATALLTVLSLNLAATVQTQAQVPTPAPSAVGMTPLAVVFTAPLPESIFYSFSEASLLEALNNLWQHGLNPKDYVPLSGVAASRSELTNAFGMALRHVAVGVTDPQSLANDIKIKKKSFYSNDQLMVLAQATGGNAMALLNSVAPQHGHYVALQSALQRLYPLFEKGGWERIAPVSSPLKLGVRHSVIPQLKERLIVHGYKIDSTDDLFDEQMLAAINDVQANLKIKPDGIISPKGRTWSFFYVYCGERIRQIQADMEKLRWLPQRLEDRHIFVNTSFSQFALIDRAKNLSMSFRTINGSVERKTPTLIDKMTYLVFNPTWTVPPTVFIKDKVEAIKNLNEYEMLEYFNKNNFQVFNSSFTSTIDPRSIDWQNITSSNVDFYIRQKPNYMNALGVVKFMLTNPYAIYLHDTNQRELFVEPMRMRSSGCVRLERPLDLAEYMLQGTDWTRQKIEDFVVKPGQVVNNETRVNVKNPIPVYLIPVTSQLNSDGVLRFAEDSYNHNSIILSQVRGIGK